MTNIPCTGEVFFRRLARDMVFPIIGHDMDFQSSLNHYEEFLTAHLPDFVTHLVSTSSPFQLDCDGLQKRVSTLSQAIKKALKFYLDGHISDAYSTLFKVLEDHNGRNSIFTIAFLPGKIFYRLTPLQNVEENFDRDRVFHIPFNLRRIIKAQRFSIAGYPTLYLGEDAYVCLKELGYSFNNKNNIRYVGSAFVNNKPINIVQILRVEDFYEKYFISPFKRDDLFNYLSSFPLIIACSYKVSDSSDTFKPEYIIPQMLMSYIRQRSNIDGVMYPSTKINYLNFKGYHPYNIALPAKKTPTDEDIVQGKFYCKELSDSFYWSEPQIFKKAPSTRHNNIFNSLISDRINRTEILEKGNFVPYGNTSYAPFENELLDKKFSLHVDTILKGLHKSFNK